MFHKSLRRSYNMTTSSLINQFYNNIPLSCDIPCSYDKWTEILRLKIDILCFYKNYIYCADRISHKKIILSIKEKLYCINHMRKNSSIYNPEDIKNSVEEYIYYQIYPEKSPYLNHYISPAGCFYFQGDENLIYLT